MRAILCDITALNYWRQVSAAGGARSLRWLAHTPADFVASALPQQASRIEVDPPNSALVGILEHYGVASLEQNAHLLLARRKDARNLPLLTYKVCGAPIPARSIYPVVVGGKTLQDIYVTSPELALLHLCSHSQSAHNLIDVLLVAMEFCGSYRLVGGELVTRCPSLTTADTIRDFAIQAKGHAGASMLQKVASLIHPNSASPAETSLALALSLPYRLGGANLPVTCLNPNLPLNQAARRILGRDTISPDILLVGKDGTLLPIEYDSTTWHDSRDQAEYDERRRNAYTAMGLKCIIIRPRHLKNPLQFDAIIESARNNLGIRVQRYPQGYETKFHDTQSALFSYWRGNCGQS